MITKSKLKEIRTLAIKIDHDLAFAGKSKGNKHLERVVQVADFLANKVGADRSVVFAGAVLHDTALPTGNDYNYTSNKKVVKNLLKPLNLDQSDLNKIAECVGSHEGTVKPRSLEAKVVHDADVLEKTGLLGIIRHTWKMTNLGKIDHTSVTDANVKMILDHIVWRGRKLHTPIAKKIRKHLAHSIGHEKAKLIVSISAEMAFRGIVTEKIAVALRKYLSRTEKEMLKAQLTLSYLKKN
ncbi:MAG: hypothetical protein COV10_04670 [Candidatus Vogelbacteria bacterium CG10_big_fil_rev_8_21_14_0_10_51_16]|uniref:HD domain-containing protein n=1 Tax=Candidatus Vogelbacteria bacterium CG10_big_fil_rev_8_21_14_0_10_51_16 TaxID=1975045 RepID=A0A2H0RD92_9BACT|nr:MAG: hypothetical protein COV10_04670 [Candidatus Vogelbacteria bacterium CG10_big_fil_rev_8_21_14_0_10_51_16]